VTNLVTQITTQSAKTAQSLVQVVKDSVGIDVHRTTISRELKNAGLKSGKKKKKPALSEKNRKERLAFAKAHRYWTVEDWNNVIFSDETKINRFGSDGNKWTWYRDGETLQPRNVQQHSKNQGGHIMLWSCITSLGVGYMCDIEGIMDQHLYKQILEKELEDTISWYEFDSEQLIFQHDNDPKHTAKSVKEYLNDKSYEIMLWPPQSPDLNPIENCWSLLKNKLFSEYKKPPSGIKELFDRCSEQWELIKIDYLDKLYESMPRRMRQVIKAKGRWTKY
jgi:hypothetical protein